jgi:hypothetical protein
MRDWTPTPAQRARLDAWPLEGKCEFAVIACRAVADDGDLGKLLAKLFNAARVDPNAAKR